MRTMAMAVAAFVGVFCPEVTAGEAEWKAHFDAGEFRRTVDPRAPRERRHIKDMTLRMETALKEAEAFGETDPRLDLTLEELLLLYFMQQRHADYAVVARRLLEVREKRLGPEHPNVAAALQNVAGTLGADRVAEKEALYRRALAVIEKHHGPEDAKTIEVGNKLAGAAEPQGRFAEVEPLVMRHLAKLERERKDKDLSEGLAYEARTFISNKRFRSAEIFYKRALEVDEAKHGPEHPSLARHLGGLGDAYRGLGRFADAEPMYVRALAIHERATPEKPAVAWTLRNLAQLYREMGRKEEADRLEQRAAAIPKGR